MSKETPLYLVLRHLERENTCACTSNLAHIREQLGLALKALDVIDAAVKARPLDFLTQPLIPISAIPETAALYNALSDLTDYIPDVEAWAVDDEEHFREADRVDAGMKDGSVSSASGFAAGNGCLTEEQAHDLRAAIQRREGKSRYPRKQLVRLGPTRIGGILRPGVSGSEVTKQWGDPS